MHFTRLLWRFAPDFARDPCPIDCETEGPLPDELTIRIAHGVPFGQIARFSERAEKRGSLPAALLVRPRLAGAIDADWASPIGWLESRHVDGGGRPKRETRVDARGVMGSWRSRAHPTRRRLAIT